VRKKIYLIVILFLSGWIFSGIQYLIFKNERGKLEKEIEKREIEIKTYRNLLGEVEKAKNEIDNIIGTLNDLKYKLGALEEKVKKGE